MTQEIWKAATIIDWSQRLLSSYRKLLKQELIERTGNPQEEAERLFFAPFVVASHGIGSDPIYNYGNKILLELWERNWQQLTSMPSRLSAEKILREERQKILEATSQQGYLRNYQCIRISRTGKRYKINDITLWNIIDDQGSLYGQAATFSDWILLN